MAFSIADASADLSTARLHRWVYYSALGFMVAAAALRTVLVFQASPLLNQLLLLLTAWLLAFIGSTLVSGRWAGISLLLIGIEIGTTLALTLTSGADFFVFLFAIPCMQVMQRFGARGTEIVLALTTLLTLMALLQERGALFAAGMAIVYSGGTILLVAYINSTRRASRIEAEQQRLIADVQQTNDRLQETARQLEQLAATRERQRLARDLHDSVTQTLYSMTLTTQSALLLLDRDPPQVESQLDRLHELTQSALSEMQVLISELTPERSAAGGLIAYLRQHLEERRRLENLSIGLEVEGDQTLAPMEEASLFRIAQEALNNIVKHAQVSQGVVRLHLEEPVWMEIEDRGRGFNRQAIPGHGGLGLASMCERAAEIRWTFKAESSPGNGTRIRVQRELREGNRHDRRQD